MSFFKKELEKEFNAVGIKRKSPKSLTSHKWQTGKRLDLEADKKRKALPAGKRISKNGKYYYESRKNRSDIAGLNI